MQELEDEMRKRERATPLNCMTSRQPYYLGDNEYLHQSGEKVVKSQVTPPYPCHHPTTEIQEQQKLGYYPDTTQSKHTQFYLFTLVEICLFQN